MNVLVRLLRKLIGTNKIINQNNVAFDKLGEIEKQVREVYNAQVFNSSIEGSDWLKNKSFSPVLP